MSSSRITDNQSIETDAEPSERVLASVAEAEGRPPLEFDRPLAEAIDPDALDRLFRGERPTGSIVFSYLGYRIRVHADGRVDVDGSE